MDYDKELKALQAWLKASARLESFKRGTQLNLSRPVVLFDSPGRSRSKHLSRYVYVQTVSWFGTLYADSLDQCIQLQDYLVQDLENKCGVITVLGDDGMPIGVLKQAEIKFKEGDSLDVGFTLTYSVAYKRSGWDAVVPQVSQVYNNVQIKTE